MTSGTADDPKLAVVTGASSGIGLALAHQFAEHGFDLVVAAENDAIADAARELREHGTHVTEVQVDLATSEGVEELARRADALGVVDALAVNAGVGVSDAFVSGDLRAHLALVDLNVRGAVQLVGLLLPAMVDRGAGGVLFTSSIAGRMPGPYMSTYAASKAFLLSFAEALRVEAADSGVHVTALMPGATDTDFFARADMEDTKLGRSAKADPVDVARAGFEALMDDEDRVVAGPLKNRVEVAAAKVLPEDVVANLAASTSKPGDR